MIENSTDYNKTDPNVVFMSLNSSSSLSSSSTSSSIEPAKEEELSPSDTEIATETSYLNTTESSSAETKSKNNFRLSKNNEDESSSVKVGIRIRPQSIRERIELCKICTSVTPGEPQVTLGHKDDKTFTYDHVFDIGQDQENIFEKSVKNLIDGCFDGYNATVLAYGQTGSGKTYTMGTSFDPSIQREEVGIIPRAIEYMFEKIEKLKYECSKEDNDLPFNNLEIQILAQFMELYNEEVIDLFANVPTVSVSSNVIATDGQVTTSETFLFNKSIKSKIEIHEDQYGGINVQGCSNREVRSTQETLEMLKTGARIRTTGATNMNLQSSRSHAIFTIHIKQCRYMKTNSAENDLETLNAKFHFVDLAGSERLKRTGATGHRAKEGICINRGLLALGNVISALGDKEKRGCHVPYRDSKLTRLLQDSLGGNSRTLMIACISPSDRDFMETLNTLRYANRARNIKNKVFVNQDKTSKQIAQLKAEIERLNYELMQYKSRSMSKPIFPHSETCNSISSSRTTSTITITPIASCNSSIANCFGINPETKDIELLSVINELKQENSLLLRENQSMRMRIKAMNETIETTRKKNCDLDIKNQRLAKSLKNYRQKYSDEDFKNDDTDNNNEWNEISSYVNTIEELKCKLQESESICKQLQLQQSKQKSSASYSIKLKQDEEETISNNLLQSIDLTTSSNKKLIDEAKKDIETDLARLKHLENKLKIENSVNPEQEISRIQINKEEEEENLNDLIQLYNDLNENEYPESNDKSEPCKLIEKNLNNIILKIDIKKRLIDELETNSKNLEVLRVQYEEKMSILHDRIKQIEDERDRVLANMTKQSADSRNDELIKKIKLEYELKIKSLQSDLNKYEQIKSKNQQMIKNALESEKQLQQLRKEIVDMKKLKVKLMNQLREETQKSKQDEQRRMKEIAILKRDHLKKDNQIKSLEAEKRCRDIVLKRKQEQIQALRKYNSSRIQSERPSSTRVSQSVDSEFVRSQAPNTRKNTESSFMSKRTANYQIKWTKINDFMSAIIAKKRTISLIERDMERFLEQRERISRKLNRLLKRYDKALTQESNLSSNSSSSSTTSTDEFNSKSAIEPNKLEEIKEQIDIMKSNIEYLQDQIAECQTNIIQLDEAKDGTDYFSLENLVLTIGSIDEAKFMIRKFLNLALSKGVLAAQKEYLNSELEYELNQLEKDFNVQQNLVQQIIQSGQISEELAKQILVNSESDKTLPTNNNLNLLNECNDNFEIDEIILAPIMDESSSESEEDEEITRLVEQDANQLKSYENLISPVSSNNQNSSSQFDNSYKARQVITSGPQDLLFVSTSTSNASTEINIKTSQTIKIISPLSNLIQPSGRIDSKSYTKIPEIIDPKKSNIDYANLPMSKSVIVQPVDRNNSRMTRSSISRHNSKDSVMSMSPPGSPNYKRISSRNDNVFNRLTCETKQSPKPEQGVIKPYSGNTSRFRSSPISLTHVAEGHSKAILSIDSYEYNFFTSSKDSTAKVWDLTTGQETSSLDGHTNNVIKIKYCPYTKLCFTVSNYYAKVWDLRESNKRCIKTLCSSGLANDGDFIAATGQIKTNTRVLQNEMPFGEKLINDISLDKYGYNLFTTSGSSVKIWDLRQFLPIGKLSGGHASSITTMLVDDNLLITGSKDHYIKIFEINSFYTGNNDVNNGKVISPKYHLTPPHYDGVQSLCRIDNWLFSCSRDMCIKKWSMNDFQCKQSMNNAHKDWIHSLDYIKNYANKYDLLLSGSRDGCLKFWNVNTFEKVADFKAHLCPIISIKVNNNLVFTGSEDATVRIWRRDK